MLPVTARRALIGYTAAVLIATGVAIPLVGVASLSNFAGYVAGCVWLLGVAWLLVRTPAPNTTPAPASR